MLLCGVKFTALSTIKLTKIFLIKSYLCNICACSYLVNTDDNNVSGVIKYKRHLNKIKYKRASA